MGDLEQVDMGEPVREQRWIDAVLDVAHQQDAPLTDLAEEDDRHVVDPCPAVGRRQWHLAADRPQGAQVDLVDRQAVTGGEAEANGRTRSREVAEPGGVARSGSAHPRFEYARDAVSLEQQRQAGDVVLVRVAQDHRVDAPVPWRDPPVELDQKAVGIRPAVDE